MAARGADESPGVWRPLDGTERADIVLLSGHAPPVRRRARPGRRRVSKARVLCARAAGSRGQRAVVTTLRILVTFRMNLGSDNLGVLIRARRRPDFDGRREQVPAGLISGFFCLISHVFQEMEQVFRRFLQSKELLWAAPKSHCGLRQRVSIEDDYL